MTSPLCMLNGHEFALVDGVGKFAGRTFSIRIRDDERISVRP